MPVDFAMTDHGDWLFNSSGDLQAIEGAGLIRQRIVTRLKIPRGTWIFDDTGNLGSDLALAVNQPTIEKAAEAAKGHIGKALMPMYDVNVIDIQMMKTDETTNRSMQAVIRFTATEPPDINIPVDEADLDEIELAEGIGVDPGEYVITVQV